jgi:hypothetical protein
MMLVARLLDVMSFMTGIFSLLLLIDGHAGLGLAAALICLSARAARFRIQHAPVVAPARD